MQRPLPTRLAAEEPDGFCNTFDQVDVRSSALGQNMWVKIGFPDNVSNSSVTANVVLKVSSAHSFQGCLISEHLPIQGAVTWIVFGEEPAGQGETVTARNIFEFVDTFFSWSWSYEFKRAA